MGLAVFGLYGCFFGHYPNCVSGERTGSASEVTQREFVGGQRLFGRFTLIRILGRGGMGIVWLAHDEELERDVALKFLPDLIIHDAAVLNDLKHETKRCLELTHKNIVRIYDFIHDDRSGCISMEYIDGDTLSSLRCDKERKVFEAAELTDWMLQLCDALDYAHNYAHIIHRDLKPANLMVNQRGELKVSDFGIARSLGESMSVITRASGRSGTLAYMSPQQLEGERGTHLDDIYSLGASVYELLTSKPPFYVGNIDRQIRERIPPSMTERRKEFDIEGEPMPAVWEGAVAACLAKDPARRPQSVREIARRLQMPSPEARPPPVKSFFQRSKKRILAFVLASLCLLGLALGGWYFGLFKPAHAKVGTTAAVSTVIPEKSVAVLPLENLSEEKENAFFADGIQDELLSNLSKIKDLKVISRTSVMQYKSGITRNLKEIAQQLGVSNVVEGSMRRSGNRIRVSVQLIDAQTDRHIWVQNYDRTLVDSITLQDELATEIAGALGATLSTREKARVEAKPTNNPAAYDAYLRGRAFPVASSFGKSTAEGAIRSFEEAVKLDPSFALAWASLSYAQSGSYWLGFDPSPARLAAAKDAADRALALDPNLPETHLALGYYRYYGQRDYTGGLAEFQQAQKGLPNNVDVIEAIGFIQRRLGHWDEAIVALRRAIELDPRDINAYNNLALTYSALRRFPEALATVDRALAVEPANAKALGIKATAFWATGDLQAVERLLANLGTEPLMPGSSTVPVRGVQALFQRRYAAAIEILSSAVVAETKRGEPSADEKLFLALSQQRAGDVAGARATYQEAAQNIQRELEKIAPDSYQAAGRHTALGWAYAGLGEATSAVAEGQKAIAMHPSSKDPFEGPGQEYAMAQIHALLGDADHAIPILKRLLQIPFPITPALLRLDPVWDQIRNDPRFQKLVEQANKPVAPSASISGIVGEPNFAAAPKKSVAVLPFENLSRDVDNAFFADGVQDEILTNLARIADLKVISRTSVMQYKTGTTRNLREIGQQLGVAKLVEGSVQRAGKRVRVNAHLVDAQTDKQLWGQVYDRDLADVFAIQSEIARTIADQLQAKLSPGEEKAIERPPTSDLTAFDLYARAKNILLATSGYADYLRAVDLLTQAVARDPSFSDAYCQLAYAHDALYFFGLDHTSARLALAEAALQAASRLRPDAGETHLARGQNLYWAYGDYDGALAELEVASQTLPNDARIFGLTGLIQRRQGRWEESTRNLERAVELDPRDIETLVLGVAGNYWLLRRYAEAKPWCARALAFEPNDAGTKVWLAWVDFAWKADTRPMHQTIDSIRSANPAAVPSIASFWIICALAERDAAAAKDALMASGEKPISLTGNVLFDRPFIEGVIARMTKDDEKARSAFTAARAEQEKIVQAQPNYGPALCVLGLIDAGLGRKEEALREGRRAVELLPVEKDSMNGANMVKYLVVIAAWVGEKDLAFEKLASVISRPASPSYGDLRLMPFWDPLRSDPRFEKIVEEAKQPVALK
jgi:TolB-like protein/Tfp pilus assembly protein PilF